MALDSGFSRGYCLDSEDASGMSRAIYVPIADSFFESSIMREDLTVRFVMLALIRLALRSGANGEVDVDPVIFAQSINLPFNDVEAAIKRLMEPDPASSSPDEDGRRIVPVNPERPFRNWRLVNWARYRHIVKMANDAARKRKERHDKKDITDASENVRKRPRPSENVATKYEIRNTKNEEDKKVRTRYPSDFEEWWLAYGPASRRHGKAAAANIWARLTPEDRHKATASLPAFKESYRGTEDRYIPLAPTYLSQRRFDDVDGVEPSKDRGIETYRKHVAELKEKT